MDHLAHLATSWTHLAFATHIRVGQCGLVTSMYFSTLALGALFDTGVLTLQPSRHCFGVLLVGAFDGTLGGEAPASKVFAYAARL
jgi:hypothetical protein